MNLSNIKIVMVGTTHPGNIGAAARAMNNMCFSQLVLVDPQCAIGEVAYARAAGAGEILDRRITVSTLDEAIADCHMVIAVSARVRSLPWPQLDPREMAGTLTSLGDQTEVALVFGREHSGLSNAEVQKTNYMVNIPTNPNFSSLNLASAIQVICYEVFRCDAGNRPESVLPVKDDRGSSAEVEGYLGHLESVLELIGFLDRSQPRMIMQRLRLIFLRCELSRNEIHLLRGILSAVEKGHR